jgi:radical SAM protein with 4Fe4S-binding SPASM domain
MLTNDSGGYVDLMSPAGIGIGALVYNYDGDVYASDEARMLAEMGDTTFRLGNLHTDSLSDMLTSEALLGALEDSFSGSAPMCSDCAFEPYCGSDPVYHHTMTGDVLGRKPNSAFHQRNLRVFTLLLDRYDRDPHARQVFRSWANR